MIDIKELRVGNRISDGEKDILVDEDFLEVLLAARNYKDYHPIPLSSSILGKAGFKKEPNDAYCRDKCFFWLEEGFFQIALGTAPIINCPCKYVHQLQNILFALTGTELTIKGL